MKLCLVQHGYARTKDEDPDRPLSDQGIADVALVAHHASERLKIQPSRVFHSGKTRARQTAETWGVLLDVGVEETNGLAPNDDPLLWTGRLQEETQDLMLVGHLPHLARLAALLLTGDSDRPVISFQRAGLVVLDRTEEGWVVSLVLPPQAV